MNFTFLTNPVWSEVGPGMAVAGTIAASCPGGVVAASFIATLFGGLAIGGWSAAWYFRSQRDALRGSVELVRRH
jgi:hypothetical protein